MSSNRVRIFREIGDKIEKMNSLLDRVLAQYEKGDVDEKLLIELTDLIDRAYQKQLEMLGKRDEDGECR